MFFLPPGTQSFSRGVANVNVQTTTVLTFGFLLTVRS